MKIYDYSGRKNVCGERVRKIRTFNGLSQTALSMKLQEKDVMLSQDSISRIEGGVRFVADYELMAIAVTLGVSTDCLVGLEKLPKQFLML